MGAWWRNKTVWAYLAILYVILIVITAMAPMPRLGIADAPIQLFGSVNGWENPHRFIAFGFLYFSLLAALKWVDAWLRDRELNRLRTGQPGRGAVHRESAAAAATRAAGLAG